jgi:hypothetical protein
VCEMKAQGLGPTAIARALGIGRASVCRVTEAGRDRRLLAVNRFKGFWERTVPISNAFLREWYKSCPEQKLPPWRYSSRLWAVAIDGLLCAPEPSPLASRLPRCCAIRAKKRQRRPPASARNTPKNLIDCHPSALGSVGQAVGCPLVAKAFVDGCCHERVPKEG